jgi:L-lysine 2,3-aminomutase
LEFASLIDKDNPNDPLLKQVIPSIKPQIETLGFSIEPLKDEENNQGWARSVRSVIRATEYSETRHRS